MGIYMKNTDRLPRSFCRPMTCSDNVRTLGFLVVFSVLLQVIPIPVAAAGSDLGPIICLDPGHPSETNPGAAVQHGLREVEVNYDVALLLKATLEEELHARVIMTRNFRGYDPKTRRLVTNKHRAEIANAAHADLFLRLHSNTGKGSGFTLYYPDRAITLGGVTGPSADVRRCSVIAARAIHEGMAEVLHGSLRDNGVQGESATYIGRKQGALTGSVYSKVPVVTIEMLYLSNAKDAKFISSLSGRRQMAEALALGIGRYLAEQ